MRARDIGLQNFALRQVHPADGLLDRGGDQVLLERCEGNGAARLDGENIGNLGATALYDLSRLEKHFGALCRSRLGPGRESFGGRIDCQSRLRAAACRDAGIQTAIVGSIHVEQLVVFCRAPFAACIVAVLFGAVDYGNAAFVVHLELLLWK